MINDQFVAGHYIGGTWCGGGAADAQVTLNPATGNVIGQYVPGDAALVNSAVAAARDAFESGAWAFSPRQRADVLLRFADELYTDRRHLAQLITRENGKLAREAEGEVALAISEARYYAGLARLIAGRHSEVGPGETSVISREPAGVAGIIVPWNAPLGLLVRSLAPALAAGCTTVIKPAPQTPLINQAALKCLNRIEDLPPGVVNSVNENGSEVGRALVASNDVDVISFTGASATGKRIMAAAADTLKRVSLELGGKTPVILAQDTDLERALPAVIRHCTILSGQMCVAASRLLVHERLYEQARDRFARAFSDLRAGPGDVASSQLGPVIDAASRNRLLALRDKAAAEYPLLCDAALPADLSAGFYVAPMLFEVEDTGSYLVQEEHFGPLVTLEKFTDDAEAVAKANATRYGLAASLWTADLNRAMRISRALRFGSVWLNSGVALMAEAETGGYRESGLGRLHGVQGLDDFLETKATYCNTGILEAGG